MEKLLIAPITKVDAEKREVWGYATLEVPDKTTPVPDVVDYVSAKAAFAAWVGNIREMHLPIAVGKAIEVQPDDEKRGIYIGARISQSRDGQDAWTKIQEGVLTAFSIGPKGIRRKPEVWAGTGSGTEKKTTVNRLFIDSLAEVSLVDNPACPGCSFDVAKAVAPEAPPAGPGAAAAPQSPASAVSRPGSATQDPGPRAMDSIPEAAKAVDPNVGGGVDREKIPASDFVDPERRRFPIVNAGDVSDAVSSYGRAKPKIPFATFKRRLTAIARRKGFESALPAEWKDGKAASPLAPHPSRLTPGASALLADGLKCQVCDIGVALQVLAGILALIDSESMTGMYGEDDAEDLDALVEAFDRVHEFMASELTQLLAARAPAEAPDAAMAAAPDDDRRPAADGGPEATVRGPRSAVVAATAAAAEGTKIEAPALEAIRALLADAVKDLAGKADLAPISEGLGKVEGAVGDLKGRVEKLEQTPAPGGPVLRPQDLAAKGFTAAEKGGAPAGMPQAQAVLADLDKAIDAATNPFVKQELGRVRGALCLKLGIR